MRRGRWTMSSTISRTHYTVAEVATMLAISPDLVRSLIARGLLGASDSNPAGHKRRWRVGEEDLQSFLSLNKNANPPSVPAQRRRKRADPDPPRYY